MTTQPQPLSPMKTGVRGLCPRCGQGHIFDGFLKLKPRCEVCGLDNGFADPATGTAFFVNAFTFILVAVVICAWIEIALSPSLWVHVLVSLPIILMACVLPLRPLKGWLVNSQFSYKTRRGKIPSDSGAQETATPGADKG
ncbi:DUF983 domain-containing protein [Rhizobium sp. Leaf341]|uniref:DUF983 domain-containing protein n=1 Tax=Rhizobium sp. Leaf341 TaxID=1736344 RepID=UPI0007129A58|nr:DUF983 domain-containing protein [Rhizobium sp. Leaf341]KQR75868.1 hypothetical protein ASG03_19620 [Rhizobium sp. Leaf341]